MVTSSTSGWGSSGTAAAKMRQMRTRESSRPPFKCVLYYSWSPALDGLTEPEDRDHHSAGSQVSMERPERDGDAKFEHVNFIPSTRVTRGIPLEIVDDGLSSLQVEVSREQIDLDYHMSLSDRLQSRRPVGNSLIPLGTSYVACWCPWCPGTTPFSHRERQWNQAHHFRTQNKPRAISSEIQASVSGSVLTIKLCKREC